MTNLKTTELEFEEKTVTDANPLGVEIKGQHDLLEAILIELTKINIQLTEITGDSYDGHKL